jgi:hypothetical protein
MSRAYRITVSESLKRVLRASDHVSTQLELLEILPHEQMAGLLGDELVRRGFQRQGKKLVRQGQGIAVTVDPETGTVTVQADATERVHLQGERAGRVYHPDAASQQAPKEALREELRQELERQAGQKTAALQRQVTDRLEGQLADLRAELDQAINRVTAEALKRKAAQVGRIKEITENAQSGSLTIVLEV